MSHPWLIFCAACLTTFALGSIHAFSVFIQPLEARFSTDRATVSLVYSLALVSLTIAVLVSPRWYSRVHSARLLSVAFLLAVLALAVCMQASSLWLVIVSYGIVFGAANGIGYGLSLTLVALALPERKGFAMSLVTAIYAIGAAVTAKLLGMLILSAGLVAALQGQMLLVLVCGVLAVTLTALGGSRAQPPTDQQSATDLGELKWLLAGLWLAYGAAVSSGLMAIGHASGIASAAGASTGQLATAVTLIAIGNALGGISVSRVADAWPARRLLCGLPLLSAAGTLLLAFAPTVTLTFAGLALVGFSYGAIIAVYPVVIARVVGLQHYARAYGRVFTAWGVAGLAAPWLAGWLYQASQGYKTVLWLATAIAMLSVIVALRLRL